MKDSTTNVVSPYTPDIWGGANLIINPIKSLTFDVSFYYFDAHKSGLNSEISFQNGQVKPQKGGNINSKALLNACVNYTFYKNCTAFVNVRNILNQTGNEAFGTDKLGILTNGGLRFSYKE